MTVERCDCCMGRKYVIGLGAMQKKCGNCNGVGYVKPAEIKSVVKRVRTQKKKGASCQKPEKEKSLSADPQSIPLN